MPVLTQIGYLSNRRPWLLVAGWILFVVLGSAVTTGLLGDGLFQRLQSPRVSVPGEARDGNDVMVRAGRSGASTMVVARQVPDDFAVATTLSDAGAALNRVPGVARVTHPYDGDPVTAATLANSQRRAVLFVVSLKGGMSTVDLDAAQAQVDRQLASLARQLTADHPGATVQVISPDTVQDSLNRHVAQDLRHGELVSLPLSLLLMVLAFGGLIAAGLPIVAAVVSIVGALTALLACTYLTGVDASVVSVVSVIGLGLCIDYGLLMVSRFREELRHPGSTVESAVVTTCRTAGRTIAFSGTTVAVSLAALLVFRSPMLWAVAVAGVSVVVVAMAVAITLVPALLRLAGTRLITPSPLRRIPGLGRALVVFADAAPEHGMFSRLARWVQRRPWLVVLATGGLLCVLALPAGHLSLRNSAIELLPPQDAIRQTFEGIRNDFPDAQAPAITIVAKEKGAVTTAAMTAWGKELGSRTPGVDAVLAGELSDGRPTLRVRLSNPDSGSAQAVAVVRQLRAQRAVPSWITGEAPTLVDLVDELRSRAPLALLLLAGAAGALLFVMTRSVLIPLKALLMSALSLAATLGILVWGFQDAHLAGMLDFKGLGGLESLVVPLTFAFGFGLAMDYEVFLVERIMEAHRAGATNDDAVALGLQRSGRIITCAALIIVGVFLGFAGGQLFMVKQLGVALAVSVAIDATLVRMLLVPATMTLLGRWNWWGPAVLGRDTAQSSGPMK